MRTVVAILIASAVMCPAAVADDAPQIVDPRGDYPVWAADILHAGVTLYRSSGRPMLRVSLTLDRSPDRGPDAGYVPPHSYEVGFQTEDCLFRAVLHNRQVDKELRLLPVFDVGCRPAAQGESLPRGSVQIKGDTIIWRVRATDRLRAGTRLTGLYARTTVGGLPTELHQPVNAGDTASGRDAVLRS